MRGCPSRHYFRVDRLTARAIARLREMISSKQNPAYGPPLQIKKYHNNIYGIFSSPKPPNGGKNPFLLKKIKTSK